MAERYYARDDRNPDDVPGGIEATVVDRLRPDVVDGISGFAIVCYCQNFEDAERIVAALNAAQPAPGDDGRPAAFAQCWGENREELCRRINNDMREKCEYSLAPSWVMDRMSSLAHDIALAGWVASQNKERL